ncbi:MAG: hypothetical protein ACWA5P_08100 [bacterium]
METIIGLILNFVATTITAIGLYYTIKKDSTPSLNILGHATLVNNDNSINIRINDYYSKVGKQRDTKINKVQSVLIEFVANSSVVINKFKTFSVIVAAIFTLIHIIIFYSEFDLFLTQHLKAMLNINNSLWVYIFAYSSLFALIYASIMLVITALYSKELYYQSKIRNFISTTKLTVLKEILKNKFGYRNFDEFPIKTLDKMMHNIAIEKDNQKKRVYNNKIKNPGNRKPYIRSESLFFDNVYFKIIAIILALNIAFTLFFPSNSTSYTSLSSPPAIQIQNEKVCEYGRNKYISNSKSWQKGWKRSAHILCNFTILNTPNGFYVLNSPNINDIKKYSNDKHVKVSGYVKTRDKKFYFTKYSFDSQTPKLVYIPTH